MKLKDLEQCWLSPKGKIIVDHDQMDCICAFHEQLALCILSDIWGLNSRHEAFSKVHERFSHTATEELEDMKWVRLHRIGKSKWVVPCDSRITKKQESVILDWCLENNVKFDDCFSK